MVYCEIKREPHTICMLGSFFILKPCFWHKILWILWRGNFARMKSGCVCGVEDVVVNGMFYRFFRQGIYQYHQLLQVPMG